MSLRIVARAGDLLGKHAAEHGEQRRVTKARADDAGQIAAERAVRVREPGGPSAAKRKRDVAASGISYPRRASARRMLTPSSASERASGSSSSKTVSRSRGEPSASRATKSESSPAEPWPSAGAMPGSRMV